MRYVNKVQEAENIAEKIVMGYMGERASNIVLTTMQEEFKEKLAEAGIEEGLIEIHLDPAAGAVYLYRPSPYFKNKEECRHNC